MHKPIKKVALSICLPAARRRVDNHHRRQLAVLARHQRLFPTCCVQARGLALARRPSLLGLRYTHEYEVCVANGRVQPAGVVIVYDLCRGEVETCSVVALDVARELLVVRALLRVQDAYGTVEVFHQDVHSVRIDVLEAGATAQLGSRGADGRRSARRLVGAVARRLGE